MSTMVKPAEEFHEFDVEQPTAACQAMVCPFQMNAGYEEGQLRPAKGGAEETEERVCGMVTLTTSSRDKLWRAMLSCSLSTSRRLGFLVKPMRLIPTNSVGQTLRNSQIAAAPTRSVL